MTINPVILRLSSEEVVKLKKIILDNDAVEALLFLKECLKPQLDRASRGRMVREFENI